MRSGRKFLIALVVVSLAAVSFHYVYLRPRYTVPILMYHGINYREEGSIHVKPRNFIRQMDFLSDKGYSVISLEELVEGIKSGRRFPHGTVVLTFDDGYEDNYLNAFPVLARHGFPATIFLVSGHIGEKEGYVNWDQVRIMKANGISFGSHTRGHVYLPSVKETSDLWEEVYGSKKDIEKATGGPVSFFCYPAGGFNDRVKKAVIRAGYKGACSTNRGRDRYNRDVFELNRVKVTDSDTTKPFNFRAKLSGYYNLFRTLRSPE